MGTDTLRWRKSTRSGNNGGTCVELAEHGRSVAVRDSKNPGQGHVTVTRAQFRALAEQLKRS